MVTWEWCWGGFPLAFSDYLIHSWNPIRHYDFGSKWTWEQWELKGSCTFPKTPGLPNWELHSVTLYPGIIANERKMWVLTKHRANQTVSYHGANSCFLFYNALGTNRKWSSFATFRVIFQCPLSESPSCASSSTTSCSESRSSPVTWPASPPLCTTTSRYRPLSLVQLR